MSSSYIYALPRHRKEKIMRHHDTLIRRLGFTLIELLVVNWEGEALATEISPV